VWEASDLSAGIERKVDLLGSQADRFLFAPAADGVEILEAEADRVHQAMAGGAGGIQGVGGHALAARERLVFGEVGQSGVEVRRRRRDVLAQQLLTDENSARGGRGIHWPGS